MKMNNFKKASAVLLASLNVGSVFAQDKIVTRSHSNFKKYEQTKKTNVIGLSQIATILGIGGLLFVGADELIVRPIIKKFSKKTESTASHMVENSKRGEEKDKNLSVFKDEKDVINSVFDNMKRYGNNKEVNDFLEVLKNFGLKLCDCSFDNTESVTVEELYNNQNTGLKELLDTIVRDNKTSSMYRNLFEDIETLFNGIKLVSKDSSIKVDKNFVSTSIFLDICHRMSEIAGDCVVARIFIAIHNDLISSASMYNASMMISMNQDIDNLCASLASVISEENKDNLKESADKFFTDSKYEQIKTNAMKYLSTYTTHDEKSFKKLVSDNKYKDIEACILAIFEICGDTLKEDYQPIKEVIKDYLGKKLKELIPHKKKINSKK